MSRKEDEDSSFRAAMVAEGVRPLAPGPGRVALPPARMSPASGRSRARAGARSPSSSLRAAVPFPWATEGEAPRASSLLVLERQGEEIAARADGVDKRTWRKLASGEVAIAGRLDLHGEIGRVAEERTLRFLEAARAAGHQAVAIVHGRGLHSGREGPVLKELVLQALTEGHAREHVLALASAPLRLGGPGVTLVLLRTKR